MSGRHAIGDRGDPRLDVTQWNAGWFVLDDWSRSKSVSVSYGLRAELQNNIERAVVMSTDLLKVGADQTLQEFANAVASEQSAPVP